MTADSGEGWSPFVLLRCRYLQRHIPWTLHISVQGLATHGLVADTCNKDVGFQMPKRGHRGWREG